MRDRAIPRTIGRSVATFGSIGLLWGVIHLGSGEVPIASATLPSPFDTEPVSVDAIGNSAQRDSGGFFQRPNQGFTRLTVFLGTEAPRPGSLILDFGTPFTNCLGKDFAIQTSSESWGPLADTALFQFFLDGDLVGSFSARLAPDQVFEFELPGNIVANRIVVTNVTPDPPGINDLATMTFIDAGVACPVSLTPVVIDIKPHNARNTINPNSHGLVHVAILATDDFDPTSIDPSSVRFGPNGAVPGDHRGHLHDTNGDGRVDLILHFRTSDTGIRCDDTSAALFGRTFTGQLVHGVGSIRTAGCR